jgi:hypothetical protein
MKKTIYILLFALVSAGLFAQTHVVHRELGQAWGGGASVDINGDGHLDFYIAGNKNNPRQPLLDGDGNPMDVNDDGIADTTERWQRLYMHTDLGFVETATNLRVVERANLDWADVDGDGLVDLFAAEHSFGDPWYHGGIYKNNGDGSFTKLDWPLYEKTNAGAFADFNNDGLIDYVGISVDLDGSFVYINQGDGTFLQTNGQVFGEYQFGIPYLEVLDFNNDGLPDIFITSNCDNPDANGGARVIADIFINNDEEPGTFFRAFIGDNGIFQKGNGGLDIADFNNDGYLDFALHGEGGTGTGEPTSGDVWACISRVYINQGDGTFLEQAQPSFRADLRPLNSSGKATRTIDWNNDGNYDLLLTGWEPAIGTQTGWLFLGDGAGNFTEGGRIPGGSETVMLFNDWNGDGVLDMLTSGHCWDAMWYTGDEENGRTASVYFNTNTSSPNARPAAPSNLTVTKGIGSVTLSWDAPADDKTNSNALSYEFYLKGDDGNYITAPASIVGGANDGVRMVQKHGNAFLNKQITLYGLADGGYSWSVQAIDASYEGSPFAAENNFWLAPASVEGNPLASVVDIYSQYNTLIVNLQTVKAGVVSVFNISGQRVDSQTISGEYRTTLTDGLYIVHVSSEGNTLSRKVLIAQ